MVRDALHKGALLTMMTFCFNGLSHPGGRGAAAVSKGEGDIVV